MQLHIPCVSSQPDRPARHPPFSLNAYEFSVTASATSWTADPLSFFLPLIPKCLSVYLSASLSVYMKHCLFNQGTRDDNYWLLEDLQFEKTRWKKHKFWCWAVRRIKVLGENQLMGGNYSNSFFHFPYYLHSLLFCRCGEIPWTKATQGRKYLFWFIVPETEQWGQAMKL